MKVIVRAAKRHQHSFLTEEVKEPLHFILTCLSRIHHFRLPPYLSLVPYPVKHKEKCRNCETECQMPVERICNYGMAGIGQRYDVYILINIGACLRHNVLIETAAHEAAHIAEYCLTGDFTHSAYHKKIDKMAQKIAKRKKCDKEWISKYNSKP